MAYTSHGSRQHSHHTSNPALRRAVIETLEQRQLLSGSTGADSSSGAFLQHLIGPAQMSEARMTQDAAPTQKQLNAIQHSIDVFETHIRAEVRNHPHKQLTEKFQAHIMHEQDVFAAKIAKRGGTYNPIPYQTLLVGTAPLVAPTLAGSATSSTSVTLTWNATTGAQKYTVQASVNGSNWSNLASPTVPTFVVTGLATDSTHKYRVTATVSGRTSPVSNVVTLTTLLPAPTGFHATVNTATRVDLSWTGVTHATGYKIERSPNNSTWTALVPAPALTGTSIKYSDTTVSAGTAYYYRLTAIETLGNSATSTVATVLTLPAVPVVTAKATSATVITLTWPAITGAATYKVESSTNGGNTWATLGTPSALTYVNTALTADTQYKYRVSAVNATGTSAPSTVAAITTTLAAPTGLSASAASTTRINLAWNPVTDATGFKLERSVDQTAWTTLTPSPAIAGNAVSYSDTGVSAGITYYYRISAVDAAGTSSASTSAHALTYPAAPTLTASVTSATQINLSWTASTSATTYLVEASTDGGNTWSTLSTPSAITYNNTALTADTVHSYRVSATNATGNSAPSAVVTKTTLLAAPVGLAATAVSATEIDLVWTAETDATGYKLERSPDNTTWAALVPSPALNSSSSSYADTGLTAGSTYYYRLSGIDAAGTSAASTAAHALTIPAVPTLTATVGSATVINLSWVAMKGAATYTLESSSDGGNTWSTVASPSTTTYANTALTADTQYKYRLSAVDATGSSAPSAVVTITTALTAPAGLTATAATNTQITLAWTAVNDATNYKIERSLDQAAWATVTSPGLNGASNAFTDTGVIAGTTYYYRISAIDTAGTSAPSTVAHALTYPDAPVLTAAVGSATVVNLNWPAIKSATTYTVQSSTDGGLTWTTIASPVVATYSNTALTADTQYKYRVAANNATGASANSSVQTVTTLLVSPAGLSATPVSATEIDLAWTAEADATNYKIERSLNQTTWATVTPASPLSGSSSSFADTGVSSGTTYYYRLSSIDTAGTSAPATAVHALTFAAAPTIAGTVTSATATNLTWAAIPTATSYLLETSTDGGTTWSTLATQSTLTYANTGLTADTAYKYRVSAINPSGTSATSNVLTLTTILGAPTNFAVTSASATEIDLSWTAVTHATNYKVERSLNNTTWTTVTPAPALSGTSAAYADTGLTAGTTYYYRISAINSVGTSVASSVAHTLTLPATPVLTGTLISANEIDLSWTAISSATVYTLQISTDAGSTWTTLATPTTTTFKSVGLTADTAYSYRVSVVNGAGTSVASNVVSLTTLLASPAGFTATPSNSSPTEIDLAWTAVTHASGYKLERSVDNSTWTLLVPSPALGGTDHAYADTGVLSGTTYFYRISSIGTAGTSTPSPVQAALTLPGTLTLSGASASDTSIALTWTSVTGASSYLLEQSADAGSHWTTAATQAGTSVTVNGLTADTSYQYRVTARDATGSGATSSVQTISTVTVAPTGFTVTTVSSPTEVDLSWTAVTHATGYKIERSQNGTTWTTLTPAPALAGTDHAYNDTTVSGGTMYSYRISAISAAGTSAATAPGTALTLPTTPTLTATVASATSVSLSWTAVNGATSYELDRSTDGTHWSTAATQAGLTFTDTGLTADTAYLYSVSAIDASGFGAPTASVPVTTLLASPVGFTVTASSSVPTEIDLAWTATTHATGYKIERSLNNSVWATVVPSPSLAGTDHAYADTSVSAGTTYFYRISGIDAVGTSAPTTAASALTLPVAPTLTATAASATSVNLSWNAVKSGTSYLLERSADAGSHWATAATQAGLTFTDTGLTADAPYQYRVSATNATGSSATSTVANVTTMLGAVTGFTVTASTSTPTEIDLAWTAVADSTGYKVERSLDNAIWVTLSPTPALAGTDHAYADTSVSAGTTYFYRISAVNAVGTSAATASASALTIPATPTLTATVASATVVNLSWTSLKSATSYLLEKSIDAGSHWTTAATQAGTTFSDTGLTADMTYQYRVSGSNATGFGATSTVGSVTTLLGAVTGFTVTASTSTPTEIDLAWTAVTHATGYKIERSLNNVVFTTLVPTPSLAGTDHAYADTSVNAGTTYFYRISAVDAVGTSAATTASSALTIPVAPTLTATAASSTSVNLVWNAVTGAATYLLEKSIDTGSHWTTAATQAGTTFTDTALAADTGYEYRVSAVNATGPSATSTVANVTTILDVVAGFTVTASTTTGTEIDLAWTATTHATGYKIERSLDNSVWTTLVPTPSLAGTDHAYADTSVLAGSSYFYRISAVNAVGTSAPTTAATALTIPATPTLTATVTTATSVHLSWTPSFGAATYLLEKSIDTGSHWTTAATQAGTTFDDTTLAADTGYQYRVSATDATGSSATSTVSSVTTMLGAVTGFTVTASTTVSTEIDLAWTAVTHATGYLIERSLNESLWTTLSPTPTLAGTDHAYADTSVSAGTTYFYRISAVNSVGTSVATADASALTIPDAPTLSAVAASATEIDLSWTPSQSAVSYLLEKSADSGSHWATLATPTTTVASDTGLIADTGYEYRVTAVNATGNSAVSGTQTVTTILAAPGGFGATQISATEIDLAWTAVTDAGSYIIERSTDNIAFDTLPQSPALAGTAAAFADTTVSAGTLYYYRISAVNANGVSDPSTVAHATTPLNAPVGLVATAVSSSQNNLTWTNDTDAGLTGFILQSSTDGTHFTTLETLAVGTTSASDVRLTTATQYYYRLIAVNAGGNSVPSTVATATTM